MTDLELKIYEIVRHIPKGYVATYSQIAAAAGNFNYSRFVGNTMHKNPLPFYELAVSIGWNDSDKIKLFSETSQKYNKDNFFLPVPCHRIVNSQGNMGKNFGMGGPKIQEKMLIKEGVKVINGKVDLNKYQVKNIDSPLS